jgi:hypothetical protein
MKPLRSMKEWKTWGVSGPLGRAYTPKRPSGPYLLWGEEKASTMLMSRGGAIQVGECCRPFF